MDWVILFGFMATFLVKVLGYNPLDVSKIYLISTACFIFFPMLSGHLSDRFGVYKILIGAIITFAVTIFPIFSLILSQNFSATLLGFIAFIFFAALYQGSVISIIIKVFPTKIRASGTAFSFNIVSAIFGGLTPLFLTFAIKIVESHYAIPFYLLFSSLITIFALISGAKIFSQK